jgi:starch synthase
MRILMVCSEFAPLAKTGGLADAVTGLSTALAARGHDVRVLLPHYAHLRPAGTSSHPLGPSGARRYRELRPSDTDAAKRQPRVYLADLGELTAAEIYTGDERDGARFLRLAEAALGLETAIAWRPDVLHCHDWHAALVPVLQRARPPARPTRTVLTLHNIGYQGVFGDAVLVGGTYHELAGALTPDAHAGGIVNFLRAGARAADALTTVSPTYAEEIRTPAYGMGLEDLLTARGDDLTGILNGVDYDTWGPSTDPFIEHHYDAHDVAPKYAVKGGLCGDLGLVADQNAPLLGVVSRLVAQKGIDLVATVLPTLLAETRASFACLGSGDAVVSEDLYRLARDNPRRVSFTHGYDEALAHRILAASDIALVPSRYEPCGLTQMYALRYGTVPVVRATGGLADTISHFDPSTGRGNGSVFRDADASGLLWGIRSALAWFDDPPAWSRLMANGMAADFSWKKQAVPYETLYRRLLEDGVRFA